jgi:hypothetical protein
MLDIIPRTRRLDPGADFFVPGNYERYIAFQSVKPSADEFEPLVIGQPIVCPEAGCKQQFQSLLKVKFMRRFQLRCHWLLNFLLCYSMKSTNFGRTITNARCVERVTRRTDY